MFAVKRRQCDAGIIEANTSIDLRHLFANLIDNMWYHLI
jgi:hypothetical protein